MKKSLLAMAVGASLGASATALAFDTTTIQFDRDGSGGGAGVINVTTMDWLEGNALSIAILGANTATSNELVAQSALSVFKWSKSDGTTQQYLPLEGSEFTFQLSVFETATGIGSSTAAFALDGSKPNYFRMYYDPTADANDITGVGYDGSGDAVLILEGTFANLSGNFTSFTDRPSTDINYLPPALLDGVTPDNQNGTVTDQGEGNTSFQIDVTYRNANFFLTDVSQLAVDMDFTTGVSLPFQQANPSDLVVGVAPNYGTAVPVTGFTGDRKWNGLDTCGTSAADTCDFHFQTDATQSFQTQLPEPGSLVLLGLGMSLLGWTTRRRKMS
jgi:hypothetical protein